MPTPNFTLSTTRKQRCATSTLASDLVGVSDERPAPRPRCAAGTGGRLVDHLTGVPVGSKAVSFRGAAGEVEAPAGLTSRGTLVAQHAASGLVVTVDTAGTPRPLATPLRGPFRMMQRSNAPGPVDVRQRGGVDSAPRSPVVPDGSVTGRRSSFNRLPVRSDRAAGPARRCSSAEARRCSSQWE